MSTRDELRRLVDELDETQLERAQRLLQGLTPRDPADEAPQPRRLSFIGVFDSGETDLAARSSQILRDELGAPE